MRGAEAKGIVLTERQTGIPVAVLDNEYIRHLGLRAGPIARVDAPAPQAQILDAVDLRRHVASPAQEVVAHLGGGAREYWQAGKSVAGIRDIRSTREIVEEFAAALSYVYFLETQS